MKKKLWALSLLITAFSCNKEDDLGFPLIHTGEVTDVSREGAVFNANIVGLGKGTVTEVGFVWDSLAGPTAESSEKLVVRETPETGVISEHIISTLRSGVQYYVRAYIKNSSFITYGKEVSFNSLGSMAPEFSDFTPKTGNLGDTLLLLGSNFSYKSENNHVQIAGYTAPVVKANQDTLLVLVPQSLSTISSEVSVSIQGNKAIAKDKFNLIAPVINDFYARAGTFGSTITISGKNFRAHPPSLKVYFDTVEAQVLESHVEHLLVLVPDSLSKRQSNIKVSMNNLLTSFSEKFELEDFSIHDFTPKVAVTGNTITLRGINFSPVAGNNLVTIGGRKAAVTYASTNKLEFKLPLQDSGSYSGREVKIHVQVIGQSREYGDALLINDKWFRLQDAPVSENSTEYLNNNCFVHQGKAYIGLNNKAEFLAYDAKDNKWTKLSDFPGTPRWHGAGFTIDDKIFFGTGSGSGKDLKDWWEYDIASDTWNQKNDFGGSERTGAVAFQVDNTGYLGTGFLWNVHYYHGGFTDFWRYSPALDSWEKVSDYPMLDNFGMWWGIAVSGVEEAIIGLGNVGVSGNYRKRVYKYFPNSNTWQRIANYPYAGVNNRALGFELGGITYIKTSYADAFYYYDESSASWLKLQTDILSDYELGIAFSIGGKAYVGLGRSNTMWEYDPSR